MSLPGDFIGGNVQRVTAFTKQRVKLTIGLPIYNEEESLRDFLHALKKNIRRLPSYVDVETIACLNGCTDRSENILESVVSDALGKEINLRVVHSEPGKLNAQLKVLSTRIDKLGPVCFMDTDTKPNPDVILKLFRKLEEDENCQVSFARVEPHYEGRRLDEFENCLRVEYESRDRSEPKKYIHGRAFLLRDAELLASINSDIEHRLQGVDPKLIDRLGLRNGLLADDIYLTRNVVMHHGVGSIVEVQDARTFFHPPANANELFCAIRRASTEIYRMQLLYPEFADIEKMLGRKELSTQVAPRMDTPEDDRKLTYINTLQQQYWTECWDALKNKMGGGLITLEWGTLMETKKSFSPKMEILDRDIEVPLDKISSVHVVPYTAEGTIIAVRQNDARDWDVPGGHLDHGTDKSEIESLMRETEEEAGVVLNSSSLQRICYIKVDNPEPIGERYIAFYTGVVDSILPIDLPNDDILERASVPLDEFLKMYGGDLIQMSEIINLSALNVEMPSNFTQGVTRFTM